MAMKFMIFNNPNGQREAKAGSSSAGLDKLLKDGSVEAAYSTFGGGHIYVVTADDPEELAAKVRGNPFFRDSHTEVVPVMDALDFVRGAKKAFA